MASKATLDLSPGAINDPGGCWVCGSKLNPEYHHIIPRAYGGEKGPQVRLCSIDHAAIDRAVSLGVNKVAQARPGLGADGLTRLAALAKLVISAAKATKGDPNKSIAFNDRFPAVTAKKLKALVRLTNSSQQAVVRQAINELHKKLIGG